MGAGGKEAPHQCAGGSLRVGAGRLFQPGLGFRIDAHSTDILVQGNDPQRSSSHHLFLSARKTGWGSAADRKPPNSPAGRPQSRAWPGPFAESYAQIGDAKVARHVSFLGNLGPRFGRAPVENGNDEFNCVPRLEKPTLAPNVANRPRFALALTTARSASRRSRSSCAVFV